MDGSFHGDCLQQYPLSQTLPYALTLFALASHKSLQQGTLRRSAPSRQALEHRMTTSPQPRDSKTTFAKTGVTGFDEVLGGGFAPHRLYLIEGVPGSGKTTLAVQFLLEGVRQGEPVLYVTLSESEEELKAVAASHGWSLDGINIRELIASEESLSPDEQYTMFHPSEVELSETTKTILADVDRVKPVRVVFDSLSELRLLAGNPLRYRRQILALKQFFSGRKCTVLLLDDMTSTNHDLQVQSIAHGAVRLEQMFPEYGAERRRLIVLKFRGVRFRGGYHDYVIKRGGIEVYPRLIAGEHRRPPVEEKLQSGIVELDRLLGGGIERGTSTLIVGAAGTGKSSLAAQFVHAAAERSQNSALFIFDESAHTLLSRTAGLGIDLSGHLKSGKVTIQQVDPAELSPGELAHAIHDAVVRRDVKVVVIDSLNGYLNAMPEERFLIIQLHELLTYLGQAGVATLLIGAHQGLIGGQMITPVDASYLADAVILMRYFEARGEVRQAISVVKKRGGAHERSIREFRLEPGRISLGEPLRDFRGVLTGVPIYDGPSPVRSDENK
jgi:circadian clock protein KaiC